MTTTTKRGGHGERDPDPMSAVGHMLTAHERLRELTAILANGIHRLRAIPPALPEYRRIPEESPQTDLDPEARLCPDGTGRQPERTPEA